MANKKNKEQKGYWKHLFVDWTKSHTAIRRSFEHIIDFWYIWGLLVLLAMGLFFLLLSDVDWQYSRWLCRILLITMIMLLLLRPMNAVYGLMGTGGSIRIFFLNFIMISFVFSTIYYFGFFKDAGISYDINQPHVAYDMYRTGSRTPKPIKSIEVLISYKSLEKDAPRDTTYQENTINYQPIYFHQILQNTIMTSLMQEPTELFSVASTCNEGMENSNCIIEKSLNKEKTDLFYWVLISQVLISWIFFGVFISLLYNKFRYES